MLNYVKKKFENQIENVEKNSLLYIDLWDSK
jgi:hypothetical protein